MDRIAILDLGTNTFHLLLAEVNRDNISVFHRERQAVKLGKGGINQAMITEDATARAVKCLQLFRARMDEEQIVRHIALGTSALRSASNSEAVLRRIKQETGIDVKVITGEQEAEYIYHGVNAALRFGSEKALIVDIGGGSVEFVIADGSQIFWKASIDIGAQRMLEQFHRHDPMLPEEISALQHHYHSTLTPLHKEMERFRPGVLAGSSGSFDTLSEIHCRKSAIPFPEGNPESPLTIASFYEIHKQLVSSNRSGRMMIPGMIEMRVDMIVVASCLIQYLVEHFFFQKIRVSSFSLKEGVLSRLVT